MAQEAANPLLHHLPDLRRQFFRTERFLDEPGTLLQNSPVFRGGAGVGTRTGGPDVPWHATGRPPVLQATGLASTIPFRRSAGSSAAADGSEVHQGADAFMNRIAIREIPNLPPQQFVARASQEDTFLMIDASKPRERCRTTRGRLYENLVSITILNVPMPVGGRHYEVDSGCVYSICD